MSKPTSSTGEVCPSPYTPAPSFPSFLSFPGDTLLIGLFLIWALWDKIARPRVVEKLDGVFAPIQEERRLSNILAQIGIVTKASRVVLAAFHNGSLDNAGYHLQKLSTVNAYTAPGSLPMAYPIRDLPIGRIMFELESMLRANKWVEIIYDDSLPTPCKDHLSKNDIYSMYNRLVRVGNLPIGILSIQYSQKFDEGFMPKLDAMNPQYEPLLEELYTEISVIMRRRVLHPSLVVQVLRSAFRSRGGKNG